MKIYRSISELPLFNYERIVKTNDLRFLIVGVDLYELPEVNETELQQLAEQWEKLNEQITEFVGINEDYKAILLLEKDIALLKVDMLIEEDNSLETIIQLKTLELTQMKPVTARSIDETVIILETQLKVQIDVKNTSVKKYYGYIKYLINNKR